MMQSTMIIDALDLSKKLISCPSVTPKQAGSLNVLEKSLTDLGFNCERKSFSETGFTDVENMYARLGVDSADKTICFAGHVDVVPPGKLTNWQSDPFIPEIREGYLYGRGTSDMKCAIACFVAAVSEFLQENDNKFNGKIAFLITCDEEGEAINGTNKMLNYLNNKDEKIPYVIVGEPTCTKTLGDIIKIGRRGSITFKITMYGIQGHVAYPHLADNPISRLNKLLHALATHKLDEGNKYFQPSNLEITSFDVGNKADNVIPESARAVFNIRFNDLHSSKTLIKWVQGLCDSVCFDGSARYDLEYRISGEPFLCKPGLLAELMQKSIEEELGIKAKLSTDGGTSDARFLKDYAKVIEFGMLNETAHKINECVSLENINNLVLIYKRFLKYFFQ